MYAGGFVIRVRLLALDCQGTMLLRALFVAAAVAGAIARPLSATADPDVILSIPGYAGPPATPTYGGYITVDEVNGRQVRC